MRQLPQRELLVWSCVRASNVEGTRLKGPDRHSGLEALR
jgi:hypothetical protein